MPLLIFLHTATPSPANILDADSVVHALCHRKYRLSCEHNLPCFHNQPSLSGLKNVCIRSLPSSSGILNGSVFILSYKLCNTEQATYIQWGLVNTVHVDKWHHLPKLHKYSKAPTHTGSSFMDLRTQTHRYVSPPPPQPPLFPFEQFGHISL